MKRTLNLLLIEDSEDDAELILEAITSSGFEVTHKRVETKPDIASAVGSGQWDIILCDYAMPKVTAPEALKIVKDSERDIPFIVVSGSIGETVAVDLMKSGVNDYIMKDRLARLGPAIERELREAKNRRKRHFAEEELKKWAEHLARSNEDLQRFAYVASHDLKEPLRMVSLYIQLLEEEISGRIDGQAKEYIQFAIEGTRRMQSLIDDLLSYSRIEMTDTVLQKTDCNNVLDEALRNLQTFIRGQNATVTHGKLPETQSDPVQMVQIFQNLVANAIKFHRPGIPPTVHLEAQNLPGQGWIFSVQDNGIGIRPEYYDRIFTVFQRLHTRDEFPGNGIGLSICKRIVERLGGQIWVDSEEGKGSRFSFTIPETPGTKFARPSAPAQVDTKKAA